jgi:hypothetical protein
MEATCLYETSVDFQRTTWQYIPEDGTLHNNLKFNLYMVELSPYEAMKAPRVVRRLDNRLTDGSENVSLTRLPAALYPQEDSWYSFVAKNILLNANKDETDIYAEVLQ